jgi:hypothetical protein
MVGLQSITHFEMLQGVSDSGQQGKQRKELGAKQ